MTPTPFAAAPGTDSDRAPPSPMMPMMPMMPMPPIAVVGVGALFPGSTTASGFWRDLVAGRDLVTEVPPTHWLLSDYYDPDPAAKDRTYARRGAFLPNVEVDIARLGIPPSLLPATDVAQLLALVVAERAFDDAERGRGRPIERERAGVVIGFGGATQLLGAMAARASRPIWVKALREHGLAEPDVQRLCDRIAEHFPAWQEATFPGLLGNVVAGRIANRLDLHGLNCTTDAACASSFAALSMAIRELAYGSCDLVITGGVDTANDPLMYLCFSKTPALSPTGDCRPFDERADGTLLGEGLGLFVLRRLADAERDGDAIYAVIRGVGGASDGRATSIYAPLPEGQSRALRRAYEAAGYGPDTVGLVEAHGTATKVGDAAEVAALREVFTAAGARPGSCALGSVKSQIGHTKTAAGAAGLFKAIMALRHRVLPPTIKVERPSPELGLEGGPFHLSTVARPWIAPSASPRRAAVSSFGFGGSNYHVTVESYEGSGKRAPRLRAAPTELVVLGAASPDALCAAAESLAAEVEDREGLLAFLARRSQEAARDAGPARLAIVALDAVELRALLLRAAELIRRAPGKPLALPTGVHYADAAMGAEADAGRVAFLFAGQGSQYPGMGSELAQAFDAARAPFDDLAAGCAGPELANLAAAVFPPTAFDDETRDVQARTLTATSLAQPAIAAVSLAQLAILGAVGVRAAAVAGHSFGELTALHAAGALGRDALLRVARRRGELMASAAHDRPGAMTAVAHPVAEVAPHCTGLEDQVAVANVNSPRQTVLSGTVDAIAAVEQRLAAAGLAYRRLAVATAFHSPIVAAATAPFGTFLAGVEFAAPQVPVFAGAEAAPYAAQPDAIRRGLAEQLARPVRFLDTVQALYASGIRTFIEIGPSAILTDLVAATLAGRPHSAIALDRKGRHGLTSLHGALAQLFVRGVALDFGALWAEYGQTPDPRPTTRPAYTVRLCGAQQGRPYPPEGGEAALPKPRFESPAPPAIDVAAAAAPLTPSLARPEPPQQQAAPAREEATPPFAVPADFATSALHRLAEAHETYQRTTAEAHMAFLRASEALLRAAAPGAAVAEPTTGAARAAAPAPQPPLAAPVAAGEPATSPASAPVLDDAAVADRPPDAAARGFDSVLIDIVSEKTGYPPEMLDLDLALDADLGIDSIKRVEILQEVRRQVQRLPTVEPADLARIRTLRHIVELVARGESAAEASVPAAAAAPAAEDHAADHLPAAVASDAADGPCPRWVVVDEDAPPPDGAGMPRLAGPLAVIAEDSGLASAVVARLVGAGIPATLARDLGPSDTGAIFLGDLRRAPPAGENAAARGEAVVERALGVARALAARLESDGGVFVTVQATSDDPDAGIAGADRAPQGGLAGLAKTAALEWPKAYVRALEVETAARSVDELAEAIAEEIVHASGPCEVALHADGRRSSPALVRRDAPAGAWPLAPGDLVVVSGGARGVTAACLELLAANGPTLLILGRTTLDPEPVWAREATTAAQLRRARHAHASAAGEAPAAATLAEEADRVLAVREVHATLAKLEERGARVVYHAVDVRDARAVAAAVVQARAAHGPVRGVVHAAGVLADKRIADATAEQLARVFGTKVGGLAALLAATADDPLRLLCVFSSIAGRFGNPGQAVYAAANEAASRMAIAQARRRGPACIVKAIHWGPWDGGMVTGGLRELFQERGAALLDLGRGARALRAELSAGADAGVEVVLAASEPHA